MDDSIIIVSKEGQTFELKYNVCMQSKKIIMDFKQNTTIRLNNITTNILERIVFYMIYHSEVLDTNLWDLKFIKNFTGIELIDLIWSSNYLEMDDLCDLGTTYLMNTIDNNDPINIKNILNMKCDFTEEEKNIVNIKCNWQIFNL
jgi:hypothetical protein